VPQVRAVQRVHGVRGPCRTTIGMRKKIKIENTQKHTNEKMGGALKQLHFTALRARGTSDKSW
jgi:hypothetical protein